MNLSQLDNIGTRDCRKWSAGIFSKHWGVDKYLQVGYIKKARATGYKSANCQLRDIDDKLAFSPAVSSSLDDQAIKDLASIRAIQCSGIYKEQAVKRDICTASYKLEEYCNLNGVTFPLKVSKKDRESDIALKIIAACERVSDERWWRRQLRKVMGRQTESVLRSAGFVRSGKSPYVSNWALSRWKSSQLRNKKTMSRLEAVTKDETGKEISVDLQDCIDSSMANPENRRNELMVRMRGYEEIAQGLGLVGLFFTLTAPSCFHAQTNRGGVNAKYDGSTPVDAMQHLNKMWSLIRSEWARQGIKTFGFRVAEPHHDGTPHCHFLLFFNPEEKERASEIFGRYALSVDGQEVGASCNRWDVKCIDPCLGSAAGYIAKYVAKNLDGYAVEVDEEGGCAGSDGALRARAWASLWGIRQFQQIGSVSVTVWRELRRKRETFDELTPEEVEPLREAADRGDWAQFIELMGGVFVGRNDQTMRPAYVEGETVPTSYCEPVKRLIGVWLKPVGRALGRCLVATRDKVWVVRERVALGSLGAAKPPPLDLCQ